MIIEETDDVLVRRAKVEPAAFGILYERHLPAIYSYIYRRTGNTAEAEDLTAKTFFSALRHIDTYQSRGVPFSAWLFRIAHNLVANWYRDNQRRRTVVLEAAEPLLDTAPEEPTRLAEQAEEREKLMTAVRRLSGERQKLLVLKFTSDLSNAEIGAIMGRSEGAVKALLHRTLEALRRILTDMERSQPAGQSRPAWMRAAFRFHMSGEQNGQSRQGGI
ncbi:MAG: sigma-70 family RNA polymerase sigma factor [Actinobacteria bacterium]|nr:sigma-70 family RNA polymerase sigma factor [Actinomycetota bacterium]MCL5025725.1 sigma-70 family RNA polymerase sigma factor [Chloroflexota bacterium]